MDGEASRDGPRRQRVRAVRRVRDILRAAILAGEFAGAPLPSESALTADHGVSRGVVREVLALLRAEGLIQRLQGAGTFAVTPVALAHSIDVLDPRVEGADPPRLHRSLLAAQRIPGPSFVTDRLGVAAGAEVVYHERLNHLDGVPVTLRAGWMPARVGAALMDGPLALQEPVFHLIEGAIGGPVGRVEVKVEACLADATSAPVLEVRPGTPLVLIERLARDGDGTPLELSYSRVRGNHLYLSTVLQRERSGHDPRPS